MCDFSDKDRKNCEKQLTSFAELGKLKTILLIESYTMKSDILYILYSLGVCMHVSRTWLEKSYSKTRKVTRVRYVSQTAVSEYFGRLRWGTVEAANGDCSIVV